MKPAVSLAGCLPVRVGCASPPKGRAARRRPERALPAGRCNVGRTDADTVAQCLGFTELTCTADGKKYRWTAA